MDRIEREPAVPRPPSLLQQLERRRILLTVGSGGVGKTTTAAALALLAARRGRRTLVMTIDPARRLATSLGLAGLDHQQREVPAEKLVAAGLAPGNLYAMMLDAKQTFDEMIRRHAPDPSAARRLMESRIYQQLSARLAGSQEYAAMEMLHSIWETGAYQTVVLDTPPTANALDFLDAPQKMVDAVESPAVQLFVSSYRRVGKLSLDLIGFGAAYVLRRLARFTGGAFLDDIAGFLSELSMLLGGMHDRAVQVQELLARQEVGFVIVTGPDPRSVDEAIHLHQRVVRSGMSLMAFIINKVHPLDGASASVPLVPGEVAALGGITGEQAVRLTEVLTRTHQELQVLARADAEQVARLRAACGEGQPYHLIPLFAEDVHDIGGLVSLGDYLV